MSAIAEILEEECGVARQSDWLTIDQPMINAFADVTRDHQFIHVDPKRAAKTPFGGTIAHGFLTLSMLSALREMTPQPPLPEPRMAVNYGCDRLRFISPVRAGSRIRLHSTLANFEEKHPGQFQLEHDLFIEIEGAEKPALTATWLARLYF